MKLISTAQFPAFLILWGVIWTLPEFCPGQDGGEEVQKLYSRFEGEIENLKKPLDILNGNYEGYLEKQKKAYQEMGNLKGMLAVDEELTTFMEAEQELSSFPELRRLQTIYRDRCQDVKAKKKKLQLQLLRNYRKAAADLSSKWTKEGKLEEAKLALALSERFVEMEKNPALIRSGRFDGRKAGDQMDNGIGMTFCWIPAGKFTMGSPVNEDRRDPGLEGQVEVEFTRGFWIGKYEVTQGDYEAITGTNPSSFKMPGKRVPVSMVSWDDASAFCEKLTKRERENGILSVGWTYRLPTEAQWEYASRAGSVGPYHGGKLEELAWFRENSGNTRHEVGRKKPNAWGLHDTHGNVWEWCRDWRIDQLRGGKNPAGPEKGDQRNFRGGSFGSPSGACRAAYRNAGKPADKYGGLGLRVALVRLP